MLITMNRGEQTMKLEWMGENREVVEALIHYCNIYASAYKLEKQKRS